MKSNQERSNECLPPKKREIPATSRPSSEDKAVPSDNHRAENAAWLPGARSHVGGRLGPAGPPAELGLQQGIGLHKALSTGLDYSPPSAPRSVPAVASTTTMPAAYPPPPPSGAPVSPVQYAHLPHTLQFIGSSQYSGPYAGFIPSQLISPTASPVTSAVASAVGAATPAQRSQLEAYSSLLADMGGLSRASGHKAEPPPPPPPQHLGRTAGLLPPGSPPPPQQSQYVRISSSPQNAARPASPPALPVHLHTHPTMIPHTLTLGPSPQVVVQYTDSGSHFVTREATKKAESSRLQQAMQAKEMLNGEVEKGRRYGAPPAADLGLVKAAGKAVPHPYESRHVVVHPGPADYSVRDASGVRASVMVLPNSGTPAADLEGQQVTHRENSPSALNDKSSLHLGKPGHRSYALSPQQALGPEGVKAVATLSPHTVIQTTHSASEALPVGLPATAFYAGTQPPVIGYLSGQQQAITYAGGLPPHLVIPGTQPLLIPVGSADLEGSGAASAIVTSSPQFAAVPHTFVTTALPKSENFGPEALVTQAAYPAMVQAQIHLPVAQSVASPAAAAPPTLPPYFMKGSIIQLANGELKKVEDLKTEDFIQSAEISTDLKIDSSTVERIADSHSPGVAVIQFAVGDHRAQVSVEVLVEYPFFVFGQGWSSCCPERTSQLFDLPCSKLSVGDVCISLTLKNLKNGSVKKGQPVDPASVLLKHSKADGLAGSRHRYAEQENGISQGSAQMLSENGELKFPEKIGLPAAPLLTKIEPSKPAATRKRRWSAPETRKLEKSEDEPPLTLPKPSLISQEVKICIEGRSNVALQSLSRSKMLKVSKWFQGMNVNYELVCDNE
ncbi:ataxin-1 isoform X1 [Cervus elaphus]|uniref:ataxin-1 isoform X1 n=1 Tax=Cervus elaphus TaxID=9860 RepID=UPI001CC2ECC5|nr:ataxin-1 isoform X1 [Cervus elaphus]XP_043764404.1 ataxin-1 isoform X1 [Cervus elaphus]XP_043764405.1 ataxin-1 isoform X1 [Cervus elaphus]XP_043764406.1 ataxin-1 isoform X1 [Cervus elaphus]XP_043764407.1 ataxin-1 isoform X1 [Cervus elaphus]XP_043764408.1 ataxin-1 isoform X1 [Cervus elaphus]XP_043764409.1 ataxin-1 isoform X1 [Cervus elaphus]XP_043764410.1 ataxin-1 isoform X1 [Cervus elaphus]XP_043764411.1 ataxin-1 isoform X1 [Cervus elaphus]XP_043764412.1 ataxin-1 isoform X1 [Cervus elap